MAIIDQGRRVVTGALKPVPLKTNPSPAAEGMLNPAVGRDATATVAPAALGAAAARTNPSPLAENILNQAGAAVRNPALTDPQVLAQKQADAIAAASPARRRDVPRGLRTVMG